MPLDLYQIQCFYKSDVFKFAVLAVIFQLEAGTSQWHPIVYWSQKITLAKRKYNMKEAEMLAIVSACK